MTEIKNGQSTGADLDGNQVRQRNVPGSAKVNGDSYSIQNGKEDLKKLQKVSQTGESKLDLHEYVTLTAFWSLWCV